MSTPTSSHRSGLAAGTRTVPTTRRRRREVPARVLTTTKGERLPLVDEVPLEERDFLADRCTLTMGETRFRFMVV